MFCYILNSVMCEAWCYVTAWCHVNLSIMTETENVGDITSYLHELNKTAVCNLGLVLGLGYTRLQGMMESPTFLQDMLAAWLQRVDNVQQVGVPTWKKLMEALKDPRVGQNGISTNIEQDKLKPQ